MEEKVSKRSLDSGKTGFSSSGPGLLPRKPPVLSHSTSASYSKAVSPPPLSPRASPVSGLKAEVIQKMEEPPTQPAFSYPATPISHPSSPPPASPPPAPTIPAKEEEEPESLEKKEMEREKETSSPYQALFPGKRAGTSYLAFYPCVPFSLSCFPPFSLSCLTIFLPLLLNIAPSPLVKYTAVKLRSDMAINSGLFKPLC